MLTTKNAIETVQAFPKEIIASGVQLDKVILFGSYAKNKQQPNSDIDVALAAKNFIGVGFEDGKYFARIHIKDQYIDIQPQTFSAAYFEQGDPFIDEIKRTGIEIKID